MKDFFSIQIELELNLIHKSWDYCTPRLEAKRLKLFNNSNFRIVKEVKEKINVTFIIIIIITKKVKVFFTPQIILMNIKKNT